MQGQSWQKHFFMKKFTPLRICTGPSLPSQRGLQTVALNGWQNLKPLPPTSQFNYVFILMQIFYFIYYTLVESDKYKLNDKPWSPTHYAGRANYAQKICFYFFNVQFSSYRIKNYDE